jgi:hypothetical protein
MFDTLTTTRSTLERLASGFEPGTLTGEQAMRVVTELGVIRRLVDGMLGLAAKRVDETSAHAASGARDAAHFLAKAVGSDTSNARRVITTTKRLEQLPETAAAVREGRLSARQAELIADAATRNPEAEATLLKAAREGLTPLKDACVLARARVEDPDARAARQHAGRRLRMWTANDGMVEGHFKVTPEVGGRFRAVIDAGTHRIFRIRRASGPHESHDAYAADALADLLPRSTVTGEAPTASKTVTNVHVVIDHTALVRGHALEGERCQIPGVGPVNVAWVREILGEAFVTAVIKKGRDITTVAHFGRHIPAHLRTAMIVGGRECVIEGCDARGYLEIDHEIDHAQGGPTAWWNLQYGCAIHHRRKTRGWKLGPRNPNTGKRTLNPPTVVERR